MKRVIGLLAAALLLVGAVVATPASGAPATKGKPAKYAGYAFVYFTGEARRTASRCTWRRAGVTTR